jgi:uncharacterized Tic20 family protein
MTATETTTTEAPSTENRLLAALAHGSVVIQGIGIIVGVLVYINQRDKSRFAAFQALQAAIYQLFALILIIGLWMAWTACYMLSMIPLISMMDAAPNAPPPPLFFIGLGSMMIPFAVMVVVWLYGLWAGLRVWGGHDFRYVLIGRWLERSGLWNSK